MLLQFARHFDGLLQGAPQTVEPPDHQGVARPDVVEGLLKDRRSAYCSIPLLLEDCLADRRLKLPAL
jgi:hypothetical protein